MTQLVELQDRLSQLSAEGIKLYAISYDDTAALGAFVEGAGIEFTMLSDEHSEVIRQYGVLNTLIGEAEEDVFFQGIPFPGFFLIDEAGKVRDKLFNRHLAVRDGIESILDSFADRVVQRGEEPSAAFSEDDGIEVTAFVRGGEVKVGSRRRLVVRFAIPKGLHIYGDPVPDGMVATSIEVAGPERMHFETIESPPTRPLELPGVDTTLQVWEDQVDFVIPMFASGQMMVASDDSPTPEIELEVTVRYQACDDHQCFMSRTQTIGLRVAVGQNVLSGFVAKVLGEQVGGRVQIVNMDAKTHLKQLAARQNARAANED